MLDIPLFLLTLVLSNPQPVLSSLSLGYAEQFVCNAVAVAAVFFSPAPSTTSNLALLQSFYPCLLPSVPYSALTSLEVTVQTGHVGVHDLDCFQHLARVTDSTPE